MDQHANDWDLLREYATTRREEPFARLAARYGDMVYATALRATRGGRPELAEDVTQAVFIILSRRAGDLKQSGSLAGWLHRTARYTVLNVLRAEARRSRHERAAARPETPANLIAAESSDDDRAAALDQALDRLRRADREILAVHYLEGKTMNQTAQTLGLSSEAARKRLSRALDRLRALARGRTGATPSAAETIAALQSLAIASRAGQSLPGVATALRSGGERGISIAHQTLRALRLRWWGTVAAGASGVAAVIAVGVVAIPMVRAAPPAPRASTRPAFAAVPAGAAPATQAAKPGDENMQCLRNTRDLCLAIMMYQNSHKRQFPPDLGSTLGELVGAPEGAKSGAKAFICPLDVDKVGPVPDKVTAEWINQHTSYLYLGDPKIDVRKIPAAAWAQTVIVYEAPEGGHPRDGKNRTIPVAMLDGHAENMSVDDAQTAIADSKKTLEAAMTKK